MRALVVDDSRPIRRIVGHMLTQLNFEVAFAENGVDALRQLAGVEPPDVALVDWNMPEMNGLEFVQAVRADDRYRDMRLLMVTTETEMSQMAVALEAGVNEYAMKPFDRAVIEDKLRLLGVLAD